ncbi:hypothetical protein B0H10DRAFT_2448677 [Mycena sp. CBHHK59/15]|nr:hypothetical protein B0H10DRAFT_2448677 [Mycena sp. CBHHK59/15]
MSEIMLGPTFADQGHPVPDPYPNKVELLFPYFPITFYVARLAGMTGVPDDDLELVQVNYIPTSQGIKSTPIKLILVIGATGAQGMAAIDGLLKSRDGQPSPYRIRASTRDVNGARAKAIAAGGTECVEGTFEDFDTTAKAIDGVYGPHVSTGGYIYPEIYADLMIFEAAKRTPSLRHYVWGGLPYMPKTRAGYDLRYQAGASERQRPSDSVHQRNAFHRQRHRAFVDRHQHRSVSIEMLESPFVGPFSVRADGTRVFTSQMGDGQMSMMTLKDVGVLDLASDMLDCDTLVATLTRVIGARGAPAPADEWWSYFVDRDVPMASMGTRGDGRTTARENYTRWWTL